MTAPATKDDLVTGCIKFLSAKPDIIAALGTNSDGSPMLFGYNNWAEMEGTQSTCAILSNEGGWASPNIHNTLRFPRLELNIWADPIRDPINNLKNPHEVMLRIEAVFELFDRYLHRVAGETQMWGQIRTVACVRLTDPISYRVPDGDGLVRLMANYAVTQG